MRLYLMRHATAEESGSGGDTSRRLTDGGRSEARKAGEELKQRGAKVTLILTSPRSRARETAEIVAAAIGTGTPIETVARLNSGATSVDYLDEIQARGSSEILIVGHNPELSIIASSLAGQPLSFRPSALACFEMEADSARLAWMRIPTSDGGPV